MLFPEKNSIISITDRMIALLLFYFRTSVFPLHLPNHYHIVTDSYSQVFGISHINSEDVVSQGLLYHPESPRN